MFLLDVNCLVALGWPNHVHFGRLRQWFGSAAEDGWATTTGVQAGFIRVSMNARVTGEPVSFREANRMLCELLRAGRHETLAEVSPEAWPDWLVSRVQGYRQVTDAGLIAAANEWGYTVATLDVGLAELLDYDHRELVRLLKI